MTGEPAKSFSDYVQYLPAVLQADAGLGQFLLAFEQILSGLPQAPAAQTRVVPPDATDPPGLEDLIAQLHIYLDPVQTPAEFLPWLASWVALSLREDWPESVKREFIRRIVPHYQQRGTRSGLEKMLRIYLENEQEKISIYEFDRPAHYFQVELELASQDLEAYHYKEKIARAIIDQEKPAHTFYALQIKMPTMRLIDREGAARLKITDDTKYPNRTILGSAT